MADNQASSSQSTANSNLIGASRVFILTPEMLKKLGLAEKVKLIQNQIKPENKVQLITGMKKSKKSSRKNNKIDGKQLPEKNEISTAKSSENEKLINSNEFDKVIELQKSEIISKELNSISEEVQSESNFKSPVKTIENQKGKIPSEDEKDDVECKLKQIFGETSPQKVRRLHKSNEENEDLEKSLKLSQSPEKKDEKKSIQIYENSEDLMKDSCDSPEIKSNEKIRSKFKPKIQWRSRKLLAKDGKKEILDSSKTFIENEEKSVTDRELSTKSIENDKKIKNNSLNEGNEVDDKPVSLSEKSVDESKENLGNKEADANLESENVEDDEEKGLNASEVEISRSPKKIISDNEEEEEIIEETFEIIEEEDNFYECGKQVSESLENYAVEGADQVFAVETLENEDNNKILDESKGTISNSSESLNDQFKTAVKSSEENDGDAEVGPLNDVETKSPLNDALEAKNSDKKNFPVELWEDGDSNEFGEIYCPSPRSSSGDEANHDLGPEILGNREDNRLNKGREEPEESSDAVTEKIDINGESLAKELEVPEEIEDNRLSAVEEELCSLPEKSCPDAVIGGSCIENKLINSGERELLIETLQVSEKIDDNSLSEAHEKTSCSSSKDRFEEIRDSNSGNEKSVNKSIVQVSEFGEGIKDNHFNELEEEKLDFPTVPLLSPVDKIRIKLEKEDHSSVNAEGTKAAESMKTKMNFSCQLFSDQPQIKEEIRDSEVEERKELPEKLVDARKQIFSDNLLNSNENFLHSPCVNEFEPILIKKETEVVDTDDRASAIGISTDNSKTFSDRIDVNQVPPTGNTPVPSPINEISAFPTDQQEKSQEPLAALELQQKTARMNLLGLSERVSVDSSLSRPSESLMSLGIFETPEIQGNDQVPLTSQMKKKRRNTLAIETIQEKPAKITKRGKRKSDIISGAVVSVPETITTPVRSSRRQSKPKIFENSVSPISSRRKSVGTRRMQETVNNDDKIPENPLPSFKKFPAISEDTESPKKLIIDELKFESDGESYFSDSRRINNEEKTEEFIEPKIPKEFEDEAKIDESEKREFLHLEASNNDKETGEDSIEICPAIQQSHKKPKKIKSKRRKGSQCSKRKSTKAMKSSNKPEDMIKSLEITEDFPEILNTCELTKNSEQPETANEDITSGNIKAEASKIPEISQLSANIREKMQENPVETPPDLSPQCQFINRESSLEISNIAESSQSVASLLSTPQTQKRRGRPKKQSLITHFLRSSPASPYQIKDPPPAETEIPSRSRGRKRRLAEPSDEAKVPEEPESIDGQKNEETSRSRSRRTTIKPDETDGEGLSESDEDQSKNTEETSTKWRRNSRTRGKRNCSKTASDRDYVPRVTKPCETAPAKPKDPPEMIKCGKCQEEMLSSAWTKHSLVKHNNMSWRDGEEKPDFNDEKSLKTLLTRTKKKKAALICESCGESKRSVVGFISHIRFCGKTDSERQSLMWICPLCTAVLMPSSREYHEKQHRDEQLPRIRNFAGEDRQKRKAAEKAVTEISRFTALVQDGEEPPSKKRKQKITIHDFIQQPQMFKTIPGVWKGAWTRSLNNNEKAHCRQPGCSFSTYNLDEICEHHSTCNFTPRVAFICKICKTFSPSQSEIEQHVRKEHSDKFKDDDSDFDVHASDASDCENNDSGKIKRHCFKPKYIIRPQAKFLTDTFAYKKLSGNLSFIPSLKWTFDFELQHFNFHLFDELKPSVFTKSREPEIYLPQMKKSMAMSNEKMNKGEIIEWKRWKRFESHVIGDIPTFYTGGPVWALAWLTLPAALYDKQLDQYVAVSTHTTMGATYEVGKSHKFKNSIQIWRIGHLSYDSTIMEDPQLSYIVSHEYGTIWCMEWCPSGAYDHEDLHVLSSKEKRMKRMGLLAAASSSGLVLIYSLPFPSELVIPNDNYKSKIFKTQPVMILQVNGAIQNESVNWQCMKISWSKTSGHDILVAGFSNGYVALWDLRTKSPILRRQINESIYLDAYKYFYAHNHAVMFVDIVSVEEKRYLATASMDRTSKTWDLEDTSAPVSSIKKGIAVDGVWMTHWPTSLTCYDDALTLQHTQTYANDVRGLPNRIIPLLPTNSTTYAIAKSDWANGVCHGTLAGEIIAAFPPQLLYLSDIHKWSKDRWLVTNIELVDFGKEKTNEKDDYHYLPETYDKCEKKFGIIFHDDLDNLKGTAWRKDKQNRRKGFLSSDTMEHSPIERYPFTSVNRISWNTNAWSYLWLAVGYENGLVRILNLNRMSVSSIIDEMLSKHAKSMFEKAQKFDVS